MAITKAVFTSIAIANAMQCLHNESYPIPLEQVFRPDYTTYGYSLQDRFKAALQNK